MTEPPLFIAVFVPEFPAQALLRLRPELAANPVVIIAGDPPLERVCSVNANAGRLGVAHSMTRAELESFPGLTILRQSALEEASARITLLEAAGAFTPRLELRPSPPHTVVMVLDMAGTTRLFGPPPQATQALRTTLKNLRFHAQIAASANLHASVSMAPAARARPIIIPAGSEARSLAPLPLSALNLTPQQAETLALWGLHNCGELAALPEVDLVVRLGQEGKRLRRLARGEHPHHFVPSEPVFALEEFLGFDSPVENLDSLLFVIGPMLDQILARAQNRAYALAALTLRLALDGGATHERTLKPALPVADRDVLLKLLHLDLQAHPPPAGILSIFLHAEPGDRSKVQFGLFAPQLPEPMRLDVTLARIAALVGEDRVGSPRLLDTHHAENFAMERFIVPAANAPPPQPSGDRTTAALRRCRPPVTLRMQTRAQQNSLRPTSFFYADKRYAVREAYGPWRCSGDWWSPRIWSREEWDVCAATSTNDTILCVLTHDLLRHQWQLEALYD